MTQLEAARKELLEHYCAMCVVSKEWKRQCWLSANDLAAKYPGELGDLPELLTAAMKEKKESA